MSDERLTPHFSFPCESCGPAWCCAVTDIIGSKSCVYRLVFFPDNGADGSRLVFASRRTRRVLVYILFHIIIKVRAGASGAKGRSSVTSLVELAMWWCIEAGMDGKLDQHVMRECKPDLTTQAQGNAGS